MKRIVSLVLALSMVLSMFATAFAGTTLTDVEGTEYESAVSALVELGLVQGRGNNKYEPESVVTRAEMAKLLVIASGLEDAAELNVGATKFSDVPANHWATGFINVASEYGFINGYPDGTFAPDAQVKYSEAVTMAIRALGYASVVESKGTWPTNYIQQARELKVLDDVKYASYNNGATRGNVAILVWNMLGTDMWTITGENESNGLNYGKVEGGITMIDKYFEDYTYIAEDDEARVTLVEVEDGKVEITLTSESEKEGVANKVNGTYELAEGLDFLNLFGRRVSALYNEETEELVMVIPSTLDKVEEGYYWDFEEDDYTWPSGDEFYHVWGTDYLDATYEVDVLAKKAVIKYCTAYDVTATYIVDEIDEVKDGIEFTDLKDGSTIFVDEDAIVLIDGEWATCEDIKANDVVTILDYTKDGVNGDLFVVSRETVEDDFVEVTYEQDIEEGVYFIKVGKTNYENVNCATVVEVDEDENEEEEYLDVIMDDDESKFYGEECTLFLNFLGEVERIQFGEVADKENEGEFYVLTNIPAIWETSSKDGVTSYVELNGESYEMKATVSGDTITSGDSNRVVMAKFDSKDRVKEIVFVDGYIDSAFGGYEFVEAFSGDINEKDIIDDNNYIVGDYKVTSNTVVYTITPIKDSEDDEIIDSYEVETSKGTEALKGVEYAIVAIDEEDTFEKAAYVFVWEEAKNTEKTFGIVEKYSYSNGKEYLTIDGTRYEVDEEEVLPEDIVGSLVAFVENDDVITVSLNYSIAELEAGYESGEVAVVTKVEGELISTTIRTIDLVAEEEDYEEHKVFFTTVSKNRATGEYSFKTVEEITWSDISVKKDDIIVETDEDAEVDAVVIIRGYKG